MSIWNDVLLHDYCDRCDLVAPYDVANINPASIDLRLGTSYRLPHPGWGMHYTGRKVSPNVQWGDECTMPADGFELQPGEFILCCSLETVHIPTDAIAFLYSKSSTGRKGLEHLHAGLGDPGFNGQWTWEFFNVASWPILLTPGERLMQMVVQDLCAPAARDYSQTGRYQNQTGATPARKVR